MLQVRTCAGLIAIASLTSAGLGQAVSAVITPNPSFGGGSVTITVQDATGLGFSYRPNCIATTMHAGQPNGTQIPLLLLICGVTPVSVPPYGSVSKTQVLPSTISPGVIYWRVQYFPAGSTTLTTEWFCFNVQPATDPVLTQQTAAQVGQNMVMDVAWPAGGGLPYVAGASLTTNTGINVGGGLFVSLDPDLVFSLSFPVPDPLLFSGFQGVLDAGGNAFGLAVNIPPIPSLAYLPLHVQAAIIQPPGQPVRLTNVVNACIAP
jgi:hypothetical protein